METVFVLRKRDKFTNDITILGVFTTKEKAFESYKEKHLREFMSHDIRACDFDAKTELEKEVYMGSRGYHLVEYILDFEK